MEIEFWLSLGRCLLKVVINSNGWGEVQIDVIHEWGRPVAKKNRTGGHFMDKV